MHLRAGAHLWAVIRLRAIQFPIRTSSYLRTVRLNVRPAMVGTRLVEMSGRVIDSRAGRRMAMRSGRWAVMLTTMRTRNGMMTTAMMRRSHPGMMPGGVARRSTHAVHMRRIMPMPVVPRRGPPVRHQTGCCNGRYGENGYAGRRVAIHRTPI